MITVNDRTSWEKYFQQPTLYKCGIFVYDNNGNKILTKENISAFKVTSRNCYVFETIASDDGKIEIVNWKNLSSSVKNYLLSRNNFLKVSFVVQQEETLKCRLFVISQTLVDRKQENATITLCSPFSLMSSTSKIDVTRTWAERIQLQAVAKAYGLRIPCVAYDNVVAIAYDELTGVGTISCGIDDKAIDTFYSESSYDEINIYNDYEFNNEEDKSDVVIYGRDSGTSSLIGSQQFFLLAYYTTTTEYVFEKIEVYQKSLVGTTWSYIGTNYSSTFDNIGLTGFLTSLKNITITEFLTKADVYGFPLAMTNIPTDIKTHYLQTPYLETGSQELTDIQNKIQGYYSHNRFIEFDCRIDPTFEPLDVIDMKIDGTTYQLIIEEMYIEFNGGFNGHIKARIIS